MYGNATALSRALSNKCLFSKEKRDTTRINQENITTGPPSAKLLPPSKNNNTSEQLKKNPTTDRLKKNLNLSLNYP